MVDNYPKSGSCAIVEIAESKHWRGFKGIFGTARQFQMDDPLPKQIAFNFNHLANLWRSNCRF